MLANYPFYLLMGIAVLVVTACAPSEESNPADRFAGTGTLTLNPDGTLFREHKFPDFTITGTLTRT